MQSSTVARMKLQPNKQDGIPLLEALVRVQHLASIGQCITHFGLRNPAGQFRANEHDRSDIKSPNVTFPDNF